MYDPSGRGLGRIFRQTTPTGLDFGMDRLALSPPQGGSLFKWLRPGPAQFRRSPAFG